ncbi:hypothetical protein R3W88_000999 [Solanum pinnatisectum]|uniref:Uncharacterized protein n=1 Tax=Solanum pinnatisectum TaxID=50273 RepID=A0AAV9MH00_9SOLN|nr:hypothetical protein R3W88_000999 [Solanum pinnatisectum]
MKQLRDDIYDTPTFKLSILVDVFSYLREVRERFPNQMEKYETFIDSMKNFKFCSNVFDEYDNHIDVVDALSNVTEVREKISNQKEKYEIFIDIMKHFKAQSLILGFNAFVPNYLENIFNDEDQAPPKKSTYKEQALKSMERLREDIYDTPPFKRPFCSSHGKL